tara:strand:+ start:12640 stop:13422 length:783 start_codon:yes stop_codon:yes gene_type:complete
MEHFEVAVIGHLGEVGSAIFELARGCHTVIGIDKETWSTEDRAVTCEFMHVCLSYSEGFIGHVMHYAAELQPDIVIVHSTVPPGTCDALYAALAEEHPVNVVHSPIRGVHPRLKSGILHYTKYVGVAGNGHGGTALMDVITHLTDLGCRCVEPLLNARTCEVGKLLSTTLYASTIATHQTFERVCKHNKVPYDEAVTEFNSTYFLGRDLKSPRPDMYPGVIGGHCLMPNIDILINQNGFIDPMLRGIVESNEMKKEDEQQ